MTGSCRSLEPEDGLIRCQLDTGHDSPHMGYRNGRPLFWIHPFAVDACYDQDYFVCWTHGRFLPCRKAAPHYETNDVVHIDLVRTYQHDTPRYITWPEFLDDHGFPDPSNSTIGP